MKRFYSLLLCIAVSACAMSCIEDIETVKNVTLSCKTIGFHDENSTTNAKWESGEQIYLYRAEDWSAALMFLSSGADSNVARFNGDTAGTKAGYYAVRPSTAVGSVTLDGVAEIKVEPHNIFLENENSSVVAPQIGESNKHGLTFKSIFGALKFEFAKASKISSIAVEVISREQGLYGTYTYNLINKSINSNQVEYSVIRKFATPLDAAANTPFYVALPAGQYDNIEVLTKNAESGKTTLYTAENVQVTQGNVTSLTALSPIELLALVGCWQAKSVNGVAAEIDIFIEFARDGKFIICQRIDNLEYQVFRGTYTADTNKSVLTGVYDDGTPWMNPQKYSIDNSGNLVLQNVNNANEVVVYGAASMPDIAYETSSRASANSVKPF